MLYHLSKQRTCCIEWIEADKNADVLEIGAGCGAVTGCLADKYAHVTCVELMNELVKLSLNGQARQIGNSYFMKE